MMNSSRATVAPTLVLISILLAPTAPVWAQAVPDMPHTHQNSTQSGELADLRSQLADANSKINMLYKLADNYREQIDLLTQQVEALKHAKDPQSPSASTGSP